MYSKLYVRLDKYYRMKCPNCQKETTNPKYCSRSCAASFTNRLSPKRKLTKKCSKCDNIVRNYRSRLCKDHFQEAKLASNEAYRNRTIGFYRSKECLKELHKSSIHAHVRGLCGIWLKHLKKKPCNICGYKLHVELCHIKPLSSFPDDALLSEVNSETNVVQLCRNCHWELDHGLVKLEE